MSNCEHNCKGEAVKENGKYVCQAKSCPHRLENGGCKMGKVSLTCDDNECEFNVSTAPGVYGCKSMDVHLGADGKCLK
jgi:hypothetical protein